MKHSDIENWKSAALQDCPNDTRIVLLLDSQGKEKEGFFSPVLKAWFCHSNKNSDEYSTLIFPNWPLGWRELQ